MSTIIFTDGSSRNNPGPGGWGAVIVSDKKIIELGGGEKHTTNNRMELAAAMEALQKINDLPFMTKEGSPITIYTDSSYVINGITKWIKGWKNNGWKTKAKDDVMNKDLWMKLDEAAQEIQKKGGKIEWKYVGGHVGIVGNERCDHIATAFADGRDVKLYDGPIGGYDLPNILDISLDDEKLKAKKSDSSHSKAKAYSYVSAIDGVIEVHQTWAECEKRVNGTRGTKYRKAVSAEDEARIIAEFEAL